MTHAIHTPMKALLGALAAIAIALCMTACADSSEKGSNDHPSDYSTRHNDRDNDGDHNDDDAHTLYFGHAANATDEQISVALVTRYFAAAASENGAVGCALLVPFVAESVAEEDGHSLGLLGTTCPVVLSKLFKLHHPTLAQKQATLEITAVRVEGDVGLVILNFPKIPEVREITERRVGDTWRLLELMDGFIE